MASMVAHSEVVMAGVSGPVVNRHQGKGPPEMEHTGLGRPKPRYNVYTGKEFRSKPFRSFDRSSRRRAMLEKKRGSGPDF